MLNSTAVGVATMLLPRLAVSAKAAGSAPTPAMPARNPWLADSVYPTSHFNPGATDSVLFAGPVNGRRLANEDVKFVPTVIASNPAIKKVANETIAFASGAVGVRKLRLTGKRMEAGNFVAEPLVFTVPAVEKERYYSLQFIDMYTFNFAYVGSRATGNGAGSYLLVGPTWKGAKPQGITAVIPSETEFAFVLYRTQLFSPTDIGNVKKIQAGYKVQPLSAFLGKPAPAAPPAIDFIKPLSPEQERTSLEFFNVLNFILQFCPTDASETGLMARFATIGVAAGKSIDANSLSPEIRKALEDGMADAWAAFKVHKERDIDTGKESSADSFGTRAVLKGDYMARMSGAVLGIYGNSKQEALYPVYFVDSSKRALNGANRYTLRFPPGKLPPVNAFWSLTMYELPASLLYANSLGRYLINSPMLPALKRDDDGGITLYIQNEPPGAEKDSNWLPAPKGPFFTGLRLYWPQTEALDGKWRGPPLQRVN